jgi:small GTP-binding protein
MNNILDFDYIFKICVIGPSVSGKTTFLTRFVSDSFSSRYISTIGADFYSKVINIDNIPIKLQLWDLAGDKRFRSVISVYCRGIFGCILMFDLSDKKSFIELNEYIEFFKNNCNGFENSPKIDEPVIYLIGNKNDLDREVSYEEANEFAKNNNFKYYEISVKKDIRDTENIITKMSNDILVKILEMEDNIIQENRDKMKDNVVLLESNKNDYQSPRYYSINKCCS